jgi:hypothetical protein
MAVLQALRLLRHNAQLKSGQVDIYWPSVYELCVLTPSAHSVDTQLKGTFHTASRVCDGSLSAQLFFHGVFLYVLVSLLQVSNKTDWLVIGFTRPSFFFIFLFLRFT